MFGRPVLVATAHARGGVQAADAHVRRAQLAQPSKRRLSRQRNGILGVVRIPHDEGYAHGYTSYLLQRCVSLARCCQVALFCDHEMRNRASPVTYRLPLAPWHQHGAFDEGERVRVACGRRTASCVPGRCAGARVAPRASRACTSRHPRLQATVQEPVRLTNDGNGP